MTFKANTIRNLSYKKSIAKELNVETMTDVIYDIYDMTESLDYLQAHNPDIIDALDGDEDEASEFIMMFSQLNADAMTFHEELQEYGLPEHFDKFFVAMSQSSDLLGWDSYESDYFPFTWNYDSELARETAEKSLLHMTKTEIVKMAQSCFRVLMSYIAIKNRYDMLRAAYDTVLGKNHAYLQQVTDLMELSERVSESRCTLQDDRRYDFLLSQMPQEVWIY